MSPNRRTRSAGRLGAATLLLAGCFFLTGCFTLEQQIFLNADGSGVLVLHIAIPDFPEEMKAAGAEVGAAKDPRQEMQRFSSELAAKLPPNVKLREVKEVRHNGALGFYGVLEFQKLQDIEAILNSFTNETLTDEQRKAETEWTARLDTADGRTSYTGSFFLDTSDIKVDASAGASASVKSTEGEPSKPSSEPGKGEATADVKLEGFDEFGKQISQLLMGMIKIRFVLHTPTPIIDSNADIVLNKRMAVWNCSPLAFIKEKKPIVMKATF